MSGTAEISRYFFSVPGAAASNDDSAGILLRDDIAAWQEAAQILTELARDEFPMDAGDREVSLEISNGARSPIFKVSMRFKVQDLRRR